MKWSEVKWTLYLPSDCRVALYELISPSISQYNSKGQTTTPGTSCPTLYDKRVWVLLRPLLTITSKMQETGPTVYGPYPRRPERLTICRYNYKGSTFSSVIHLSRKWILLGCFLKRKRVSSRGLGNDAIFWKSTQSGSRAGIWLNPRPGLIAPEWRRNVHKLTEQFF